jgi:O-antigen ligase
LITLLSALLLAALPLVVSPGGFDQFRLPKDVVFGIAAVVIAGIFVAANGLRRFWRWRSWEMLLLVAVLYVLVHSLVIRPDISSWSVAWIAAAALLLFAVSRGVPVSSHPTLWLVLAAISALNAIFAVLQFYGRFPLFTRVGGQILQDRRTAAGLIGDVNSGAFVFGLSALMMLYPLWGRKKAGLRVFAGLVLALNLVGLVVTQTMAAILAFGLVFALWVGFHSWWLVRTHRNLKKAVLLALGVAVVGLGMTTALFISRGMESRVGAAWSALLKGNLNVATSGRYPVYQITWRMIKDKPVLGHGLGSFATDFFRYRAETDMSRLAMVDQPGAFREVHNDYLQVWEELGVIGLLLFVALLILPCLTVWQKAKESPDPKTIYWTGMLCLGMVFTAIDGLAFFPFRLSVTGICIVLLLAGLRAVALEQETSQSHPPLRRNAIRIWRPATCALVIVVVTYLNVQRWRADSEMGVAAYVLESAYSRSLPAQHKRIYAEAALERLRRAEALNSALYENYNLQGSANMLMSNHEEAARQYERAARYLPSPEVFTNEAIALMAAGEPKRAKALLETALRYNPNYQNAARALEYLKSRR